MLSTKGSFLEDFVIFLSSSMSMRLTNKGGRRVTSSLSLSTLGIRSGWRDRASGVHSLLPGT